MILSKIAVDSEKSEFGTWVDIDDVTQLKVARERNPNWLRRALSLAKKYKIRLDQLTEIDNTKADKFLVELMAETILLDWKHLYSEEGVEIPYSAEKARELLSNPAYIDFRERVESISRNMEFYRVQDMSKQVKKP